MRVLIILVNYNSTQHTIECVKSLSNQIEDDIDIYIVDNASNEQEIEMLKSCHYKNLIIDFQNQNKGFAGGNNVAIEYAIRNNYTHVLLLNNDTVVPGGFIQKLKQIINLNSDKVISPKILDYYNPNIILYAGGDISYWRGSVKIRGVGEVSTKYSDTRKITFAHGCCMVIPIDVIKNVGLLPEDYFLYYEDVAYSADVLSYGYSIVYQGDLYIFHKESISTGSFSDTYQYYFLRNR